MYSPTAKSYFSGGGLFDIGFIQAGVDVIQSVDMDAKATGFMKMNKHYFKHNIITEDLTQMEVLSQPKSDVMIFTWPCQKYSRAGQIHGTRTGEELFLHGFRHIAIEQPEMYWIENVPGMKKFKVVMEAITKIPGYYVNEFCPINASHWLPQSRKRMIIVGTRKPYNIYPPENVSRKPRIKDILERHPKVEMSNYISSRIAGNYRDKPHIVDPKDDNAIASCCVAHYAKDRSTRMVKDKRFPHGLRPFTVREWARLQGVPDDYYLLDDFNSYKIIGNGVAVPMARWCGFHTMRYFN